MKNPCKSREGCCSERSNEVTDVTVELVAELVYVEDDAPDVVGDATHRTHLWSGDDVPERPADGSRQEHEHGHADGVDRIHECGSEGGVVGHMDSVRYTEKNPLGNQGKG